MLSGPGGPPPRTGAVCIRGDDISVHEKTDRETDRDNTFRGRIVAVNPFPGPMAGIDVDIGLYIVLGMSRKAFESRHLEKWSEIVITIGPDIIYLISSGITGRKGS